MEKLGGKVRGFDDSPQDATAQQDTSPMNDRASNAWPLVLFREDPYAFQKFEIEKDLTLSGTKHFLTTQIQVWWMCERFFS